MAQQHLQHHAALAAAAAAAAGLSSSSSGPPQVAGPTSSSATSGGASLHEFSIFVGDLAPNLREEDLVAQFLRPPITKSAKIMTDPVTGVSRGFGFVRFSSESDSLRALVEMQGVYVAPLDGQSGGRPLRVCPATPKNKSPAGGQGYEAELAARTGGGYHGAGGARGFAPGQPGAGFGGAHPRPDPALDPNNTTVFVGGLSSLISEDTLRTFFVPFGEISYVKIPPGKGCGFVQFVRKIDAERAIERMQGFPIGGGRIRLSWGRSQGDKAAA
ncbi:RNA-binding domain-containing protein, partial [Tilletiaria anomala UBC 951]